MRIGIIDALVYDEPLFAQSTNSGLTIDRFRLWTAISN